MITRRHLEDCKAPTVKLSSGTKYIYEESPDTQELQVDTLQWQKNRQILKCINT